MEGQPGHLDATETAAVLRDQNRAHWRLAAILFLGGGIGAIPSDALHRPAHPPTVYLLPLLAIVSAAVCWVLSNLRLRPRWLHATAITATLEIALTVAFADRVFAIYYVFVAIYAAYVFHGRRAIAFQVGFASLAVLAPIVYEPDTARDTLVQAFALIPTLALAAATVTFLRERLEGSERRFRLLAERDPLTAVGNYRMLTDRLPSELARHERRGDPLGFIVVDLDNFKGVNDRLGHQRGDEALRRVAACLENTVRGADIVVRQGGDEFCIVAPNTDCEEAELLADRVEDALGSICVDPATEGFLAATTGWAVFPTDSASMEGLMAEADNRLLASKAANPECGRTSIVGV
jgi:diguanylate cyclase (GGDEF)-like protein